jgi:tetratricopeptide (TPR) repeat protein
MAKLKDSQSYERYIGNKVERFERFDTCYTEDKSQRGITFVAWLNQSIARLVAEFVCWGPSILMDEDGHPSPFTMLDWAQQLLALEASGLIKTQDFALIHRFVPIAKTMLRAAGGDYSAVKKLANAVVQSDGGLDECGTTAAIIVGAGTKCLPPDCLEVFVDQSEQWLKKETARIGAQASENPSAFRYLKTIADLAPASVNRLICDVLNEQLITLVAASDSERLLQEKVIRYNDQFKEWQNYSPKCDDPLTEGRAFVALETEINGLWLAQLSGFDGLTLSQMEAGLVGDGRFLSGACSCMLGWLRNAGLAAQKDGDPKSALRYFDLALELLTEQVQDMDMLSLRHRSQTHAFENMINCGFGSLLDSGQDGHIVRAVALLEQIESRIEWQTGRTEYQIACVYARAGLVEPALKCVELCKRNGGYMGRMKADQDLKLIHQEKRFLAAVDQS